MINFEFKDIDLILALIYEKSEIEKKPVHFNLIVQELQKFNRYENLSKNQIKFLTSSNIDKLFDFAILLGKWEKLDNQWYRVFVIDEMAKNITKKFYFEDFIPNLTASLSGNSKNFLVNNFTKDKSNTNLGIKEYYQNMDNIIELKNKNIVTQKEDMLQPFEYSLTTTGQNVIECINSQMNHTQLTEKQ